MFYIIHVKVTSRYDVPKIVLTFYKTSDCINLLILLLVSWLSICQFLPNWRWEIFSPEKKKNVFKDLTQSRMRPFYNSLIFYIGYLSFPRVILFSNTNKFWRLEWQTFSFQSFTETLTLAWQKSVQSTETFLCLSIFGSAEPN